MTHKITFTSKLNKQVQVILKPSKSKLEQVWNKVMLVC